MSNPCQHLQEATILPVEANDNVCVECVKTGDSWVHLRKCLNCGKVHCCDSSLNKHATAHHRETGHPVIISAEAGERWAWCYPDQKMSRY